MVTLQLWVGVEYLGEVFYARYLEVDVLGIDAFVLKLLVEVIL